MVGEVRVGMVHGKVIGAGMVAKEAKAKACGEE